MGFKLQEQWLRLRQIVTQKQGINGACGFTTRRGQYTHNIPFLCREDLRHLPICSVDPPGCKDIDDALHVRPLPNGTLELGVHIADVTHFLRPGTAMDTEAASRQD